VTGVQTCALPICLQNVKNEIFVKELILALGIPKRNGLSIPLLLSSFLALS